MDAEEKTAHEVRHLQASVRDLQNALRLALGQVAPGLSAGPAQSDAAGQILGERDPYARILANNDRGVRLRRIGVAVVGLNGVGCLVAEAFARYGVQRLVVADTTDVRPSDLDTIPFQSADVGHRREERVAARLRRLNPDVAVQCLGVPLAFTHDVVRALRSASCDQEAANDSDVSSDEDERSAVDEYGVDEAQPSLHLVVLCVRISELALRLNDLCCTLGVPLAIAFIGTDGMSGESLLVVPGVSSCLQCLEKRKMWKMAAATAMTPDGIANSSASIGVSPVLPSMDCILAGLCVQNAVMHLLSFGCVCSRLEYDGFLEGLERSELVPPVLHCASQCCQHRQSRRHQLDRHFHRQEG